MLEGDSDPNLNAASNDMAAISDSETNLILESLAENTEFETEDEFWAAAERLLEELTRARVLSILLDGLRRGEIGVSLGESGRFDYDLSDYGRENALDLVDYLDRKMQDLRAAHAAEESELDDLDDLDEQ